MQIIAPQSNALTSPQNFPQRIGRSSTLTLVFSGLLFVLLFLYQTYTNLRTGANRTPIRIRITSSPHILSLPLDAKISIVSQWSEMELIREGQDWSFEKDQLRDANNIVIDTPSGIDLDLYNAQYAIDSREIPEANIHWYPMVFQKVTDEQLLPRTPDKSYTRYQITPEQFRPSIIQKLLGKRSINWGGDVNLLLRSLPLPATFAFSTLILLYGLVLGATAKGNRKTEQNCPKNETQKDRIPGLDHLRGIAICMVLAYHSVYAMFGYDQLGWKENFPNFDHPNLFLALSPATFGYGGVAIFFAVSGFCIHLSYSRSRNKSWFIFFLKRWFRIYPPFFACLVLFAFFFPTTRYAFENPNDFLKYYSQCFLVFNLHQDTFWACNGVFWSVAVEWQLYLIYPLLLVFAKKLTWPLTLLLALAFEVSIRTEVLFHLFQINSPNLNFALRNSATGYVFTWLIGAKLADDYIHNRPLFLRRVPIGLLLFFVFLTLIYRPLSPFSYIAFSLVSVSLISRLLDGRDWTSHLPTNFSKFLAFAGSISFSLYLFHQPLLNASTHTINLFFEPEPTHQLSTLVSCCLSWSPIFVISHLSYRFLELPSIEFGKLYIRKT